MCRLKSSWLDLWPMVGLRRPDGTSAQADAWGEAPREADVRSA
ncbi:MAG: hypothetical protein ACK4OK_03835 [Thermoflexus sp.]